MSDLMTGLQFVCTYLDDVLVLTKNTGKDHLHKLDLVLDCTAKAGLQIYAQRSSWETLNLIFRVLDYM